MVIENTEFLTKLPLGIYDPQKFDLPIDTEVITVENNNGVVTLLLKPGKSKQTWRRTFYVLDNDRVMQYPNLGLLGLVVVGEFLFYVYEDDLECTLPVSEPNPGVGSPWSRATTRSVTWSMGTRKVEAVSLRGVK